MNRKATSVKEYLEALPADRKKELEIVRKALRRHLPKGVQEGMQYGMIGYFVPHSVYPPGYHCDPKEPLPFAGLAAQKNHLSLYMMFMYVRGADEAEFRKAWMATGRKLDMGRCCVRFKSAADAALDVIGSAFESITVQDYVDLYESNMKAGAKRKSSKKVAAKKKLSKKTSKKTTNK